MASTANYLAIADFVARKLIRYVTLFLPRVTPELIAYFPNHMVKMLFQPYP